MDHDEGQKCLSAPSTYDLMDFLEVHGDILEIWEASCKGGSYGNVQ